MLINPWQGFGGIGQQLGIQKQNKDPEEGLRFSEDILSTLCNYGRVYWNGVTERVVEEWRIFG